MPVDPVRESVDHVTNPLPAAPFDQDALLSAVLDSLAEPLVRRIGDCLRVDRTNAPGADRVSINDRARGTAQIVLSDCEYELRRSGDYLPSRGRRLVEQFAATIAERTLRRFLASLEVAKPSIDSAATMLHNEFADADHWSAAAQLSAAKEPLDPEPLRPRPLPDAGTAQA